MITVLNIKPLNKGSLLAVCDVHIAPWKMTLKEVKIFQKGSNRWITLPSKQNQLPDGSTRYDELISFDSDAIKQRFREQIMTAIDAYLEQNPEMKTEDVIKFDDDLPF